MNIFKNHCNSLMLEDLAYSKAAVQHPQSGTSTLGNVLGKQFIIRKIKFLQLSGNINKLFSLHLCRTILVQMLTPKTIFPVCFCQNKLQNYCTKNTYT